MKYFILILLSILLFSSCNKGLDPTEIKLPSYLRGRITYLGGAPKWPPDSTVKAIRVFAIQPQPKYDSTGVFNMISAGKLFWSNLLATFVSNDTFSVEIPYPPVVINYLAVVQNWGTIAQWRVVGVYTITGDNTKHSSIQVLDRGRNYDSLNIIVDFDNLPPQPF